MRRLLGLVLIGLGGAGILVALGVWQVQRLEWKRDLIGRIESRLAAEPVAVPDTPDPEGDAFLRVRASGTLARERAWVLTTKRPYGPGYRALVPVRLEDGRRIIADLGFVPDGDREDVVAGTLSPRERPITVTGALFWPEGGDSFTPEPDAERDLFFSRDVAPLAEALETRPVLVVAESHSLDRPPIPERLGVDLPNNHLNYAITWFSLAVVWLAMTVAWARRSRTRPA